jgi:hypothetical protein
VKTTLPIDRMTGRMGIAALFAVMLATGPAFGATVSTALPGMQSERAIAPPDRLAQNQPAQQPAQPQPAKPPKPDSGGIDIVVPLHPIDEATYWVEKKVCKMVVKMVEKTVCNLVEVMINNQKQTKEVCSEQKVPVSTEECTTIKVPKSPGSKPK